MKNYYQILGVSEDAKDSEIKSTFRKLAKKFHPDKNAGDSAAEKRFKEISEAYDVLSNPEKKHDFDTQLKYGNNPFAGFGSSSGHGFGDLGSIFEQMFSGFTSRPDPRARNQRNKQQRNRDLRILVDISFRDAIDGCSTGLEFRRPVFCNSCQGLGIDKDSKPSTCSPCGGTGRISRREGPMVVQLTCRTCMGQGMIVIPCQECNGQGHINKTEKINFDIPAGVSTGQVIRLAGKGESTNPNTPPGNLMVEIRSPDQHENFYRKDLNIYSEETVDFIKAALGKEITIKTVYGEKVLEIPRGCAPESTLMISDAGVKTSNKKGNHYVKLKVSFPVILTADQEELLVQFEKTRE